MTNFLRASLLGKHSGCVGRKPLWIPSCWAPGCAKGWAGFACAPAMLLGFILPCCRGKVQWGRLFSAHKLPFLLPKVVGALGVLVLSSPSSNSAFFRSLHVVVSTLCVAGGEMEQQVWI